MGQLSRWTLRGVRTHAGLYLGLTLLVALVATIVPGGRRAGRILATTIDGWAQRLALCDLEVAYGASLRGCAARARALPGVRAAEERLVGGGRISLSGGPPIPARIEVLPEDGPPRLNGLALLEGRYPAPDERAALVDRSVARWHGVRPGARIVVQAQGDAVELPVLGVVVAAEYPVTPIHPEHALPTRGALAPVWVTPALVAEDRELRGRTSSLLLTLEPGADPRAVARAAAEVLDSPVAAVIPREEGPAQRFADMVLAVFDAYLPAVDATLTALAATLLALVVVRRVRAQRAEVALWLALGHRPLGVAGALLLPGVVATLAGLALGGACHGLLATHVHAAIEQSMGVAPALDPGPGPELGRTACFLLAAATLAGAVAAGALLRRQPARLLREGPQPGSGLMRRLAGLTRGLPTSVRLGLGQAFARPVAAFGLLAALGGMFTTVISFNAVHRSYEIDCAQAVERCGLDAIVRLEEPRPIALLDDLAARAQGRAEPLLTGVGLLRREQATRYVQVVGLDAAGWGRDLRVWRGRRLTPGAQGEVLVDRWLAEQLALAPGQEVDLLPSESSPEGLRVAIVGVVETLSMGRVYVELAAAQSLYGRPGQANGAQVASHLAPKALEAALGPVPGVERALALGGAREEVLATLEGGRVVLDLALLFSALLTATFLAVLGTLDARERLGDAAVLHALGWHDRALAVVVGVEMAVRTTLALGLALLASRPFTLFLLARLGEADRHTLDAHAPPAAPWILAALCLVLVPLAAAPAWRTLARLSPAGALKLLARG